MIVAFSYIAVMSVMVVFEKSLIFFPSRYPDGFWDTNQLTERIGVMVSDHFFEAEDGTRLHAWLVEPPADAKTRATVLFFHGNAGNLSHRIEFLEQLARLPANVFVVGYRGYGRSEGSPSEKGLYQDARAAWQYLTDECGRDQESMVIFGKSLGGAVAVDLATEVHLAGLIVESSFTSVPDMASRHYPIVPKFIIRTKLNSLAKVPEIQCPKLFIHSKSDEIVPFELGWQLYEAASEPKTFYEVVGANHNNTWLVGGDAYFDALHRFIENAVK